MYAGRKRKPPAGAGAEDPRVKKAKTNGTTQDESEKEHVRTINCGLKSIFRQDLLRAHKQQLLKLFSTKSIEYTKLSNSASLQFLCRVNSKEEETTKKSEEKATK